MLRLLQFRDGRWLEGLAIGLLLVWFVVPRAVQSQTGCETATVVPTTTPLPPPPQGTAYPALPCVVDEARIPAVAPAGAPAIVVQDGEQEQALLALINKYRPASAAYVWDDGLSRAATWMAEDVAARDDYRYENWSTRRTFAQHSDSRGRDLAERFAACGVSVSGASAEAIDGEVHGAGSGDATQLSEWQFASEELALITNTTYRRIGIARRYSPYAQTVDANGTKHFMVWVWVLVVAE